MINIYQFLRGSLLTALIFFMSVSIVLASWAYGFVVNNGKIFELTDEIVEESFLGYEIGEVTYHSDIEGTYSGNFSNELPVGTLYFTIQGIAPEEAIAVKKDGFYVKATYGG